jgi:hypothetical protein
LEVGGLVRVELLKCACRLALATFLLVYVDLRLKLVGLVWRGKMTRIIPRVCFWRGLVDDESISRT